MSLKNPKKKKKMRNIKIADRSQEVLESEMKTLLSQVEVFENVALAYSDMGDFDFSVAAKMAATVLNEAFEAYLPAYRQAVAGTAGFILTEPTRKGRAAQGGYASEFRRIARDLRASAETYMTVSYELTVALRTAAEAILGLVPFCPKTERMQWWKEDTSRYPMQKAKPYEWAVTEDSVDQEEPNALAAWHHSNRVAV